MAIIQGNAKQGSTRGFYPKVINGSLRFNKLDNAYLEYDITTTGDPKTWTFSCWFKICTIANDPWYPRLFDVAPAATANKRTCITVHLESVGFQYYDGSTNYSMSFPHKYRDPSAWYHMVFVYDSRSTTTSTDRLRMYINGERLTPSSVTYPSDNFNSFANTSGNVMRLGNGVNDDGYDRNLDAYMANVHFIDGQALTASDFGETKNGVWVAKDYAGTFGTNGFYLTFEDDTQVEAFNTVLYRGNGSNQSVTGTGFAPDLVWVKNRSNPDVGIIQDTVRGPNRNLIPSATNAEFAEADNDGVRSFDSDGFTLGFSGSGAWNNSGNNYVAWCWDAGANNAVTGHSSVTYTGNSGTQRISGFPFRPDLIWIKARNTASFYHHISDSVRGFDKYLFPNVTLAEETNTTRVTSTTDDGMILGNKNDTNTAYNYVAWAWDAGDGDPVSNTNGSITSTVKASQANGFSIVSYSGVAATDGSTNGGNPWGIGHGLTSAPDFVIYKMRTSSNGWYVYHSSLASTEHLRLDSTAAKATETVLFRDTPPDASELYVGGWDVVNRTGNDYIAYCWHDVTGKQKFGSYTGTGASGNSVTTGFRPGWVMIKRTDIAEEWVVYDSSRSPFNPNQLTLNPNRSDAEGSYSHLQVQFDSNGFTLLSTDSWLNASGGTYIYAAFAGSYSDYITDYNTDGSIDSRVKASDTTGFSVASYTGNGSASQTVGHGLGSAPTNWMVILKNRTTGATDWPTFHSAISSGRLKLNTTDDDFLNYPITFGTDTITLPSVNDLAWSASANDYIAYCWSETTGYSKFGSYTGNGSTSGPTVTCGFKPSMILIKRTDTTGNWVMSDTTRDVDGTLDRYLLANSSDAEGDTTGNSAGNAITITDTGFQLANTNADRNASGGTYIYAAFADTREAAFWLDQSGNDNDWQPVNLDHNDTVADSPTNNFATWNPLNKGSAITLKDGNLSFTQSATWNGVTGTVGVSSGQWYFEYTYGGGTGGVVGVAKPTYNPSTEPGIADTVWRYRADDGTKRNGGASSSAYGATWTTGDVIGVAYDLDAGTLEFYKNGVSQGVAFTNLAGETVVPVAGTYSSSSASYVNFGQQPFKYDPPA